MARKSKSEERGYGKILEAWLCPEDAGDPVGCLATTYTFNSVFFEEECLSRFVGLDSDPETDATAYVIEQEIRLSQLQAAAVLADQEHCTGSRSLRWDLLPGRPPNGLLHAKICLLVWTNQVRLILSSANLTEDGYRHNQEVFGVLDYFPGSRAPIEGLLETVNFLRRCADYCVAKTRNGSPSLARWHALLDRAMKVPSTWGISEKQQSRRPLRVYTSFTGAGLERNVLDRLIDCWPASTAPNDAHVYSPFFDAGEPNRPCAELWKHLRKRGDASVSYYVTMEDLPPGDRLFAHAPKSLLTAQPPGRAGLSTEFFRLKPTDDRPHHAKGIYLSDDRWVLYNIGSSNFTSAGLGLHGRGNFEANLAFLCDTERDPSSYRALEAAFPPNESIEISTIDRWEDEPEVEEASPSGVVALPSVFQTLVFIVRPEEGSYLAVRFAGDPGSVWRLEDDSGAFRVGAADWKAQGRPGAWEIKWPLLRPPSGLWVRWLKSEEAAWWPVEIESQASLPPPKELCDLPLDMLVRILTSARPIHKILAEELRKRRRKTKEDGSNAEVDPHRKVDVSGFLLQRTRRVADAIRALREKLEAPCANAQVLEWRLYGPFGAMALAEAISKEAHSDEERAFLMVELVMEFARVKPRPTPGYVTPAKVLESVKTAIGKLREMIPAGSLDRVQHLREYIDRAFERVRT